MNLLEENLKKSFKFFLFCGELPFLHIMEPCIQGKSQQATWNEGAVLQFVLPGIM